MSKRARVIFKIPDGGRVAATPESAKRAEDGEPFVWVRRHDTGKITRAFHAGELA